MNSKKAKTTTPELRKKIILNLLKDKDSVSVQEMVNECNASEITGKVKFKLFYTTLIIVLFQSIGYSQSGEVDFSDFLKDVV